MTDAELIARLRDFEKVTVGDARDAADRIEALTEQLAAARQDADEAEAYAWKLEQELWPRIWRLFQRLLAEISSEAALNKGESHD